jgi:hypothetical protein
MIMAFTVAGATQLEAELSSFPPPCVVDSWVAYGKTRREWLRVQGQLKANPNAAIEICQEDHRHYIPWVYLQKAQRADSLAVRINSLRTLKSILKNLDTPTGQMPPPLSDKQIEGPPNAIEMEILRRSGRQVEPA